MRHGALQVPLIKDTQGSSLPQISAGYPCVRMVLSAGHSVQSKAGTEQPHFELKVSIQSYDFLRGALIICMMEVVLIKIRRSRS